MTYLIKDLFCASKLVSLKHVYSQCETKQECQQSYG